MVSQRILGVKDIPQKIIRDDRGEIRHFMRHTDFNYRETTEYTRVTSFGEVYFSMVMPDVVKAWHVHKRMMLNYICVVGKVIVGLYDGRESSPTFGITETYTLQDHGELHTRLSIPPGVWNGFRAPVGWADPVLIANCADMSHDPDEIVRWPPDAIDYDWGPYKFGG
jgi:dTDP-4-dehydrorhamnose 3,5-epimerase